MLEKYGFYLLALGAALIVIAYGWLLIRAFKQHLAWGLSCFLIPPLWLFFFARHWNKARWPVWMMVIGGLIGVVPYGMSLYEQMFPDLGPREKMVDGELHITLTGWEPNNTSYIRKLTGADKLDYTYLKNKKQVVVLQMANLDVTDQTLEYLKGMDRLRELDLNDTQVTDEGLIILAQLPSLKELRLARMKISDEGFRKHLA